jgi:hypothetical protein
MQQAHCDGLEHTAGYDMYCSLPETLFMPKDERGCQALPTFTISVLRSRTTTSSVSFLLKHTCPAAEKHVMRQEEYLSDDHVDHKDSNPSPQAKRSLQPLL